MTLNPINKSQQDFSMRVINVSPDIICGLDTEGITTFINPATEKITGYNKDEIIGENWIKLFYPDENYNEIEELLRKSSDDEVIEYEMILTCKNGDKKNISWSSFTKRDNNNNILEFIVFGKDITMRKHAEEAISDLQEYQRVISDASFEAIFLSNKGICLSQNLTAEKMFGYTLEEAIGKPGTDWIAPEGRDIVIKHMMAGDEFPYETIALRNDGTTFAAEIQGRMFESKDIQYRVTALRDITLRKQAEETMNLFQIAVAASTDAIGMSTPEGKHSYQNEAFDHMFGDIGEDPPATLYFDQSVGRKVFQTIMTGYPWTGEVKMNGANNTILDILLRAYAVKDENGKVINLIGVHTDITERKKAELELIKSREKAEESDKLKSAFLANISHEIRTPLNAIVGFSDLLIKSNVSKEKKEKFQRIIRLNNKALTSLINDIIDISKIEANQLKLLFSDSNISELLIEIKDTFNEIKKDEGKENIDIIYKPDEKHKDLVLNTDSLRFKQVIQNLIENSLKYTKEGYIEFGYNVINNETVQFFVKDTGIGISDNKIKLIFDRFRQANDEVRIEYGGVGLGLAISKNIIELMDGKIWVKSSENKGSTFYFTVPFKKPLKVRSKKEVPNSITTEYDLDNITILVAEDNEFNFEYIKEAISGANMNVIWAKNGKEAVEICKNNNNIDLVLMDIKMPVMDGFEALKEIKLIKPNLRIIAQTAYALPNDEIRIKQAGFNGYLTKPINDDDLIRMIKINLNK